MAASKGYYVELTVGAEAVDPDFDATFERVAEALHECEGAETADLGGNSVEGTLTFCLDFPKVKTHEEAFKRALAMARTALHVAGASTPGWEEAVNLGVWKRNSESAPQATVIG